jgi:HAE1 family hydrophobic/amphiphilic exporter-1
MLGHEATAASSFLLATVTYPPRATRNVFVLPSARHPFQLLHALFNWRMRAEPLHHEPAPRGRQWVHLGQRRRRAERDVRRALSRLDAPRGLTWTVGGAEAERRRTASELYLVALLSVALVFLVLAGEFASFTTPLLVMLTAPLAGAGGILVLWLTGQSLNAVSLIGIVVMIGLADNEAVVKLDAVRQHRAAGRSVRDAVILGGRERLRAIMMTSLTTVVGVLPLVLGLGAGGELYQPLAAGVIGGSVTALLVTLFLLPTAYAVTERWKGPGSPGPAPRGSGPSV